MKLNELYLSLLTPKRKVVAIYVCQAKSNIEIAEILNIKPNSVKDILTYVYKILKVKNRKQLMCKLLGIGPVPIYFKKPKNPVSRETILYAGSQNNLQPKV